MNCINMTGNIGNDLELKTTPTGKKVLNVSLAVRDRFDKNRTHWFPVVCWNTNAEYLARYAVKGTKIAVTGTLAQRKYKDEDGNNHNMIEIVADQSEIISGGKPKQQPHQSSQQPEDRSNPPSNTQDPGSLPF